MEENLDGDKDPLYADQKELASQRSHDDATAANGLFQSAGQSVILINGGAATAILTFATSDKAPVQFGLGVLAGSLTSFAAGVLLGTLVIIFQAVSVRHYAVRWQRIALGYPEKKVSVAKVRGDRYGLAVMISLIISGVLFFVGVILLAADIARHQ